jgi:hypothetical protein
MRVIGYRLHHVLDIITVIAFVLAPFALPLGTRGVVASYVLAAAHTGVTLMTTPPAGRPRVFSYAFHGWIELMVAIALPVAGLFSGVFRDPASRAFLVAAGAVVFVVWLLSDYRGATATPALDVTSGRSS